MTRLLCALLLLTWTTSGASAQSLGAFRWQLEPHCNIVSVIVTQSGGVYRMEGTDDQCGGDLASAIGTAFLNPDGTVGIGLNVVSAPGGAPVHVDAAISPSSLGGTWRDSAGNTGTFVFRTGPSSGGTPRPQTGTIGAVAVNPSQVQLRIGGTCPANAFMVGVTQAGNVTCQPVPAGGITGVTAGAGLQGGGASGGVSIGLNKGANGAYDLFNSAGFVVGGLISGGVIPTTGAGTRMMWYPGKWAIRAGNVAGNQWDDFNIGIGSTAFGSNTVASGQSSVAMGDGSIATGGTSTAMGLYARADGVTAVAMGWRVKANGDSSVVLGSDALALPAAKGAIILSDRSSLNTFTGFAPNEFLVRAAGGTGIYSNAALTSGVTLAPGASAWAAISDVNMKENFRDLDDGDVLAKIARMPIREWNYKAQDAVIRHIGPTAQDFRAAFGLGEDPLRISTIDADGVALRALQALEKRTRDSDALIADLLERIAKLEARQR